MLETNQSKKSKAVIPELLAGCPEIRLKGFRAFTGEGCSLGPK
jgi:hypothetical protein